MIPNSKFVFDGAPLPFFTSGISEQNDPTLPIVALSISQISKGECKYEEGATCEASSEHKIHFKNSSGGTTFAWVCTGGTIDGAADLETVKIKTQGSSDITFTLECTVQDDKGTSDTIQKDFTHSRTLNDISITDIIETQPGTCEYEYQNTCVSESIHTVQYKNGIAPRIVWTCSGGTIIDGQGTDTVKISTTSNADVTFDLRCDVNENNITSTMIKSFTHTKTLRCDKPPREYLNNWTFDCGLHEWTNAASYPADLIDNQNGSVSVISKSKYGSIVPMTIPSDNKEWILQCNVSEISGKNKMSIRTDAGVWTNHPFTTIGNHLMRKTCSIQEIHVGANNDMNASMTLLDVSLQSVELTELPCMTSPIAPYGICSSSSEYDSDYAAWKGCNCQNASDNAWNTEIVDNANIPYDSELDVHGHYWEWIYSESDQDTFPAMVPTEFTISPRADMPGSWYTDNNPQGIVVFGIKPGDPVVLEKIFTDDAIPDWNDNADRTFTIDTDTNYIGVRIYITQTNNSILGNEYNTGFGNIRMSGEVGAISVPSWVNNDFSASDYYQEKTVLDWTLASGNPLPKYNLYLGDGSEDDVLIASDIYPGYEYYNNPGIYSLYIKAHNTALPEGIASQIDTGEILAPRTIHISVQSTSQPEIETVPSVVANYTDRGAGKWWIQIMGNTIQELKFSSSANNQDITEVNLLYAEHGMLNSIEGLCSGLQNLVTLDCLDDFNVTDVTNASRAFYNTGLSDIDLSLLDFDNLGDATEMFMNSPLSSIKMPDTPNIDILTRTFSNIQATQLNLRFMKDSYPTIWVETFKDSSNLRCINYIDTTQATDTTGIFDGTVITRPNSEQIQDITDADGASYDWLYVCHGKPLADHPLWTKLDSNLSSDDTLRWEYNGDEIIVDKAPAENNNINLGYDTLRIKSTGAVITGKYKDHDSQAWLIPFTKLKDKNNLVGARINKQDSIVNVEFVQRKNGSWSTFGSFPYTPDVGVEKDWTVIITDTDITVYIDGNFIGTKSHATSGAGYFGISTHKYRFAGQVLVRNYHVGVETQIIPCDNQDWTVSASSAFGSSNEADKAFNCTTTNGGDAWVSGTQEKPWWLQATDVTNKTYRPTKIEMKGRTVVEDSHMNARRPNPLILQGLSKSNWVEIQRWEIDNWNAAEVKSFVVQDNLGGFSSFRFVWGNNGSGIASDGAQIGYIKLFGYEFPDIKEDYVVYRGQIVSYGNDKVIYTPASSTP